MKVLIDASNIKCGGGVQVSVSFINDILQERVSIPCDMDISFIVSTAVSNQLQLKASSAVTVVDTDIKTVLNFRKIRILQDLARDIDVVYTVFGPSWWRPKHSKRVVGFANAWVVTPHSDAYNKFSFFKGKLLRLKNYVLGKFLFREGVHYITETEEVKEKFIGHFQVNERFINVVPNTLPYIYGELEGCTVNKLPAHFNNKFKFISITHNYPHKNLDLIEKVGCELEKLGHSFIFLVTFQESDYQKMSESFKRYTYNLGVLDIIECPAYYQMADALFLPTSLECFSVSYLEAMYNELPILTSNRKFAREICGDAAIYFDPNDVNDILNKIDRFLKSPEIRTQLVKLGSSVISRHPKSLDRTKMYLNNIVTIGMGDV